MHIVVKRNGKVIEEVDYTPDASFAQLHEYGNISPGPASLGVFETFDFKDGDEVIVTSTAPPENPS